MMKGLKGCIWERRKGVTSWARLRLLSLFQLLVGLEACARKAWLGGGGGGGGRKGRSLIPEVEPVRRWAIAQGNVKEPFALSKIGRVHCLFELENRDEVDRVLNFGRRRCRASLLHLRKWL